RPKIIVDSDEMLANPAKNMPLICEALGLLPCAEMLSWTPGQKAYDGPWWPHWYANVHKSTGFGPAKAMPAPLRPDHEAVVEATLPAYDALYKQRLQFE
ncbi:MAG TPA: sulfotransferase family protein, partial [Cryomorphaceae bacterium]|nr:sulfotransferase family protein [Cryomorphaceae bacterium]